MIYPRIILIATLILTYSCSQKNHNKEDELPKPSMEKNLEVGDFIFVTKKDSVIIRRFNKSDPFEIIDIKKTTTDQSSEYPDTNKCKSWIINKSDLVSIIKSAKIIDHHEWHYLYNHNPCIYEAKVIQGLDTFLLTLNSGSWFSLQRNDSTWIYSDDNKYHKHLFMTQKIIMR